MPTTTAAQHTVTAPPDTFFTPPDDWVPDTTLVPPRRSHGRPTDLEPARVQARPDLEWFRENLVRGMIKKNLTASDVARALWGEKKNAQGNVVAKGRDRMTGYLSGAVYPNEANITRLCALLDLTREQLALDARRSGTQQPRPRGPGSRSENHRATPGATANGDEHYARTVPPPPPPGTPGTLLFQITQPGKVFLSFAQHLDETTAFRLLAEIKRLTLDERVSRDRQDEPREPVEPDDTDEPG